LPSYLSGFVQHSHEDFFVSPFFDPQLVAQLMSEGFLPIATSRYLLPKLHKERCVIYPLQQNHQEGGQQRQSIVHTSKSTKKKLKRFSFSINQDFDGVVKGCHNQHGVAWLYPQIVSSFKYIHELSKTKIARKEHHQQELKQVKGKGVVARVIEENDDGTNISSATCNVKLYSIEVWNQQTGKLAGGELGYAIGTIYTSLTGFSSEDSAGSVQLATLGKMLTLSGYEMWDLGMSLDYKTKLGAKEMERVEFVRCVRDMRVKSPSIRNSDGTNGVELSCEERLNCKEIFDMDEWKC